MEDDCVKDSEYKLKDHIDHSVGFLIEHSLNSSESSSSELSDSVQPELGIKY